MTEPAHTSVLTSGEPLRLIGEGEGEWTVRRHEIGEFVFDGLIVGELFCGDYNPLPWPKGKPATKAMAYSVVAELAPDHERTCLLGLRFSDAPVVRWEASGVSCAVDAGVSGFVSADRVNVLDEDRSLLEKCGPDLVRGTHLDLDGRSFVLSSSGWGDSVYDVYWGFAADGTPAWAAIDFHILMGALVEEHRLPLALDRGIHRVAEGIEVHVGLFSRWKLTLKQSLPEGESAQIHIERPNGPAYPKPHYGFLGSKKIAYDISPFKDATALVVRHITGYKPMDIVG